MSNPETYYLVGDLDLSSIFQPYNTWTQQTNSGARTWVSITSSSDGTMLAAVDYGGFIYTSTTSQANPTGYLLSNGDDLNTIFAPYVGGEQAITTGFQIASGADLNTIFASF